MSDYRREMCSGAHFCKFWEIGDNILETVLEKTQLQQNIDRKSYVAYRIATLPVPLNDLEGHFCCLKRF